jgi:hypothetical protein
MLQEGDRGPADGEAEYRRRNREIEASKARRRAAREPLDALERRWRTLNQVYFGGELRCPKFDIADPLPGRMANVGGMCSGNRITIIRTMLVDPELRDAVLVHEMLHQWLRHTGQVDGHGDKFVEYANVLAGYIGWPEVTDPKGWPMLELFGEARRP